ncbi:MAG: DUF4912 domain-containing protein [Acidobacteria bacterium]|nr:DUF4912 domain-containing protein [Acidobacteriota bacterium]MBK9529161.1 DUF4912 domain-containing protein [Acidobacteriota bacterium]MBP7474433.1 DUF4912 domain-containing protein [Pyrinomonadaceae bacterium]MBP9109145.1 DUF4912 domain-containing protein [Pyrinomonadaceae bacterium]
METNIAKKNATTTKKVAKKSTSVDPFAELVEVSAPIKRAVKAVKAEAKAPIKRSAKKVDAPVTSIGTDAFAAPATESSPVKKRAVKKASATKTIAVAGPAKKTTKKPVKKAAKAKVADLDVAADLAAAEPTVELSPVFKALADVSLPELEKENRARLLMQSPTRLYFYWSVCQNPWKQLKNIFGDNLGSYTLVLKLTDIKRGTEQIHPCEAEGNWWFSVEPDSEYQAEIGFYAVNRPYFRVIYSNTIQTPRRSPSSRPASDAQWTVSANKFAEVLDVAGFSRDAFDVAMAGDDVHAAENTTQVAFSQFIGSNKHDLNAISAEDIRYAMLALASGFTLEELRTRVSPALFAILQANTEKLKAANALAALTEYFDIDEAEWTEEEFGSAVYGASLVHFPKTLKTKNISSKSGATFAPRYNPVSSHSLR